MELLVRKRMGKKILCCTELAQYGEFQASQMLESKKIGKMIYFSLIISEYIYVSTSFRKLYIIISLILGTKFKIKSITVCTHTTSKSQQLIQL